MVEVGVGPDDCADIFQCLPVLAQDRCDVFVDAEFVGERFHHLDDWRRSILPVFADSQVEEQSVVFVLDQERIGRCGDVFEQLGLDEE